MDRIEKRNIYREFLNEDKLTSKEKKIEKQKKKIGSKQKVYFQKSSTLSTTSFFSES